MDVFQPNRKFKMNLNSSSITSLFQEMNDSVATTGSRTISKRVLNDSVDGEEVIIRRVLNDSSNKVVYRKVMNDSNDNRVIYRETMNDSANFRNKSRRTMNDSNDNRVVYRATMNDSVDSSVIYRAVEDASELNDANYKKIVRKGKVVKKLLSRKARHGLSIAEYRARIKNLKRARLKAHTPAAERKRRKSMLVREKKHLQTDGLDINLITSRLKNYLGSTLVDAAGLEGMQRLGVRKNLSRLSISINDDTLTVKVPVWSWANDGIEADNYKMKAFDFEVEDDMTEEEILDSLIEDFDIANKIVL